MHLSVEIRTVILTRSARGWQQGSLDTVNSKARIDEDPATGSAAVALATMWVASGEPSGAVVIHQGEEMGHPSRINLRWSGATASIGGTVIEDDAMELIR